MLLHVWHDIVWTTTRWNTRHMSRTTRLRQAPILISRTYTTKGQHGHPIVHIPTGSYIYAFGAPSHTGSPLLRDLGWTMNDGEAWAIISGGGGRGKNIIFNVRFFLFKIVLFN